MGGLNFGSGGLSHVGLCCLPFVVIVVVLGMGMVKFMVGGDGDSGSIGGICNGGGNIRELNNGSC